MVWFFWFVCFAFGFVLGEVSLDALELVCRPAWALVHRYPSAFASGVLRLKEYTTLLSKKKNVSNCVSLVVVCPEIEYLM